MEKKIVQIKHNMNIVQDRQKSYADKNKTPREFKVGYHVYLQTRLRRSSLRMGTCAKMTPWFCGPFEILDRVRLIAYRLTLPCTMKEHNLFHVSLLKKYVNDYNHIIH
jgi:hypothetical protein